jgi:hypothetical protein
MNARFVQIRTSVTLYATTTRKGSSSWLTSTKERTCPGSGAGSLGWGLLIWTRVDQHLMNVTARRPHAIASIDTYLAAAAAAVQPQPAPPSRRRQERSAPAAALEDAPGMMMVDRL